MITRIYADAEGESHFEDVDFAFEETDFVPPAPPVLMTALASATGYRFELVHPGWHGDWHPVPERLLAVYLSGAGRMEASDGEIRELLPGRSCSPKTPAGRVTSARSPARRTCSC